MFTEETSLIIPTRNRVKYLKKTLEQINITQIKFSEIIVVDSSDKTFEKEIDKITNTHRIKLFKSEPSTSLQRNIGLEHMTQSNKFVMFLDDDVIFSENMFVNMNNTIENNRKNENIVGYGFNQIQNIDKNSLSEKLKKSFIFKVLNLYPDLPGKVALSGWQSKILNIKNDTFVDWIYTTACIFKTSEIQKIRFDLDFGQYSYLEDLDFSLNFLNSGKKIIISADAKYSHPLSLDRSGHRFGIYEVRKDIKLLRT